VARKAKHTLVSCFCPIILVKTTNKRFLADLEVHNTSLVNPERRNDPEEVTTGVPHVASKAPKVPTPLNGDFAVYFPKSP
jgi:hypothetical protein